MIAIIHVKSNGTATMSVEDFKKALQTAKEEGIKEGKLQVLELQNMPYVTIQSNGICSDTFKKQED